jgi:hypothetical protein
MAKQQRQFRVKEILSIIILEEAHLVYVQLGGHGGGLMKPNSQEMEIASNKSSAKIRDNNSQRLDGKATKTVPSEGNTIHNYPRRGRSSLCAAWGPWWRFNEAKQSRNRGC